MTRLSVSLTMTIKDLRLICVSRDEYIQWGILNTEDEVIIRRIDKIRRDYIQTVGLKTYVNQLIGGQNASISVARCVFYDANNRPIKASSNNCTVLEYLIKNFTPDTLPYRIQIKGVSKDDINLSI